MNMPTMDGLEATRRIRALQEVPQPVVVMLTGNVTLADQHMAIEAGADAFESKPCSRATVATHLQSCGLITGAACVDGDSSTGGGRTAGQRLFEQAPASHPQQQRQLQLQDANHGVMMGIEPEGRGREGCGDLISTAATASSIPGPPSCAAHAQGAGKVYPASPSPAEGSHTR
mmetsp:Transcript_17756/g.56895  ORF Transcript_17756/g.56895 Transcript_17756/m.56895 type:complete len:173 (+) Transcript_17756:3-521(+)